MKFCSITEPALISILHFCSHHCLVLLSIEHWIHTCVPTVCSQVADNILQSQVASWYSLLQQQFFAACKEPGDNIL
jgi:hypothetical protein